MVFTQAIGKILFVVFLHESLVVNEEDIGRHGNGGITVVNCCCGVEQFEALGTFFCLRWLLLEGGTQKAIELTGGDGLLSMFADLRKFGKHEADRLFF